VECLLGVGSVTSTSPILFESLTHSVDGNRLVSRSRMEAPLQHASVLVTVIRAGPPCQLALLL